VDKRDAMAARASIQRLAADASLLLDSRERLWFASLFDSFGWCNLRTTAPALMIN
jgi:hypothetical protein